MKRIIETKTDTMPPINLFPATLDTQIEFLDKSPIITKEVRKVTEYKQKYKLEIVWRNIILFLIIHAIAVYGFYLAIFQANIWLSIYAYAYGLMVSQGITAGAHRLWAHKCYKVKTPLKVVLIFFQTSSFQNSIYVWCRDHRLHHKYTDTDADPHNAKRGFFFSHMGWLLVRKHPDVLKKGQCIDMSDLTSDPLIMFQHRYYVPLVLLCTFVIPSIIPWYLSKETYFTCFCICGVLRYIYSLHATWLVNSAAHLYGTKPYDKNIGPCENRLVSFMATGEGWHNYHHVFPWDYKAAELGKYGLNWTLYVINFCARRGWAYDLKTVSREMIEKRIRRTGDGSIKVPPEKGEAEKHSQKSSEDTLAWGWDDACEEDKRCAIILDKMI